MYVSADEDFVDMIYPALPPIRGRRKYLILILCHNKYYIIYKKYITYLLVGNSTTRPHSMYHLHTLLQ